MALFALRLWPYARYTACVYNFCLTPSNANKKKGKKHRKSIANWNINVSWLKKLKNSVRFFKNPGTSLGGIDPSCVARQDISRWRSFLKMFWLKKIIKSSHGADSRVMIKDGSILWLSKWGQCSRILTYHLRCRIKLNMKPPTPSNSEIICG